MILTKNIIYLSIFKKYWKTFLILYRTCGTQNVCILREPHRTCGTLKLFIAREHYRRILTERQDFNIKTSPIYLNL